MSYKSKQRWAYDIATSELFLAESNAKELPESTIVGLLLALKCEADQLTLYIRQSGKTRRVYFWGSDSAGCDVQIECGSKGGSFWRFFEERSYNVLLDNIDTYVGSPLESHFSFQEFE